MWQRVNEQYDLGAAVVSQSVIAPPAGAEFDEELERYVDVETDTRGVVLADEYPYRGAVLVDEAHNFRNINRRSEGLRDYLGNGDHKVVLMSATPQNLGPRDIYRQLRFFLDETQHGLNIEPMRLEDYFRSAELWHGYRMEQEEYRARRSQWRRGGRKGEEPQPPPTPRTPRASVEEVLTPVFIRRRRRDLRELYGDTATVNGQPVQDDEGREARFVVEAADRRVGGAVKSDVEMRAVESEGGATELVILSDTTFMGRLGELGQPIIRRKANTTLEDFARNLANLVNERG